MAQERKRKYIPRRLKPGARILLALFLLAVIAMCSTLFIDLRSVTRQQDELSGTDGTPAWEDPVTAYVTSQEGELTAAFYNEGLARVADCGRGSQVMLESWTPFITESGDEYYHVYWNGQVGYIPCEFITDDLSELMQETQVYVRSTVNLLKDKNGLELGGLAERGTLLRLVGYDYFSGDGQVNMYQVRLGDESGWIKSEYVTFDYASSMENWSSENCRSTTHIQRGDAYGGGDAGALDFFPHEKGDFGDANVMPKDVYALYIPAFQATKDGISRYIEYAKGTAINTLVITIQDEAELAYESDWVRQYGILDRYTYYNTVDEMKEAIQMAKDAGFYLVARMSTFKDSQLAQAYPQWAITDPYGGLVSIDGGNWPSAFSRDIWQYKVGLAVEAVDNFGFNEIQFDYVRFPDYIINYEREGSVDMKNANNESKAQVIQRFLTYAADQIHAHGAYVGADVFGETSNDYVAPYGQYWPAISNVVDVISGMPYPDHFNSYWDGGSYFRPFQHPYQTLFNWARNVSRRQQECATPAVVRTWMQIWDDYGYEYDHVAIQREITAVYDNDISGGYMLWHAMGSLSCEENITGAVELDYYDLYQQAEEAGKILSDYMKLDTGEGSSKTSGLSNSSSASTDTDEDTDSE